MQDTQAFCGLQTGEWAVQSALVRQATHLLVDVSHFGTDAEQLASLVHPTHWP